MISPYIEDQWKTPSWCYRALEDFIDWKQSTVQMLPRLALEPCSGDGRISEWIQSHGWSCIDNEPQRGGFDYLEYTPEYEYHLIITNPPFSIAEAFVIKALSHCKTCCFLLPIRFLATKGRKQLFIDNPLDALYVLSKRPAFERGPLNKKKGTDNNEYAWFIWDKQSIFNKHGIVHL